MADINQFGSTQPSRSPDPDHCAQCEVMLADALDRTLSLEDQAIFDRHLAICPDCSRMFIDAKLGMDLLSKLHDVKPEPSATLLERIFASTGPAAELPAMVRPDTLLEQPAFATSASIPAAYGSARVLPFRQRILNAFRPKALAQTFMQPRLAMTAAMAFFSIALTLNLTGLHISQLRASDFTPSSIKRTFYDTNARVVRSVNNLRIVYELESRVQDLQRDNDSSTAPANTSPAPSQNTPSGNQNQNRPEQQNQQKPSKRSGSSRTLSPGPSQQFSASLVAPSPLPHTGPSPWTSHEPRQVFVIVTPTVFNSIEQGGQA